MSAESLGATTVEPVTEPDGEVEAGQPGAESPPAASDPGKESSPESGVSKRIDELTRNWRETERERDFLRTLLSQQPQQPPKPQAPPDEPAEPELKTLADFNFDERAYGKYMLGEATKAARRELDGFRKEATESQQKQTREQTRRDFDGRIEAFSKAEKISDFDVAFRDPRDGGPTITEAMADVIMATEQGPGVLYYLGKNTQLSEQIARMPPAQQMFELGRIAAGLVKPAAPKVSGAPPPAPRVDGGSAATATRISTTSPESDKLSDDEWAKAERARTARAAKRAAT